MATTTSTPIWLLVGALAGGCTLDLADSEVTGAKQAEDPGFAESEGPYEYGTRAPHGAEQLNLGSHQVLIPLDAETREPINSANEPSRLHRDLGNHSHRSLQRDEAAQKLVSLSQSGRAEQDVFASQWWNQGGNGIARRWRSGAPQSYEDRSNVDALSPAEKWDLLTGASPVRIETIRHCNYSQMTANDGECKEEDRHEHAAVEVMGPATAWELQHHGIYQTYAHPDSWWGHCNGWSSYATSEPLGWPHRDIRIKRVAPDQVVECNAGEEGCVYFSVGDIEALFTELWFSDGATFTGRRCNVNPDKIEYDEAGRPKQTECRDINAGTFHIAATGMMGENGGVKHPLTGEPTKLAFVIDHNWDWQVWNFPLVSFQVLEEETLASAQDAMNLIRSGNESTTYTFNPDARIFVRVKVEYEMISDGVSYSDMARPADQRSTSPHRTELNYVLELDNNLRILGGEWIQDPTTSWGEDNKKLHPDFLWAAVKHQGWGENADDTGGNDDNPYLAYPLAQAILRCANDQSTCAAGGGGGEAGSWEQAGTVSKDGTREAAFSVDVPVGATDVSVVLTGDANDADLYVRFGQAATTSAYDCRPYENGSNETCTFPTVSAGPMHVMVRAYSGTINFQVRATWQTAGGGGGGGGGPATSFDQTGNVSASGTREAHFAIELPAGAHDIAVALTGTGGDADLYTRFGEAPTASAYDCRPYGSNSNENCNHATAPSNVLHVMVRAYSGSIDYALHATWQLSATSSN